MRAEHHSFAHVMNELREREGEMELERDAGRGGRDGGREGGRELVDK